MWVVGGKENGAAKDRKEVIEKMASSKRTKKLIFDYCGEGAAGGGEGRRGGVID